MAFNNNKQLRYFSRFASATLICILRLLHSRLVSFRGKSIHLYISNKFERFLQKIFFIWLFIVFVFWLKPYSGRDGMWMMFYNGLWNSLLSFRQRKRDVHCYCLFTKPLKSRTKMTAEILNTDHSNHSQKSVVVPSQFINYQVTQWRANIFRFYFLFCFPSVWIRSLALSSIWFLFDFQIVSLNSAFVERNY